MKIIILITLFILNSCSPPSSFNDDLEDNKVKELHNKKEFDTIVKNQDLTEDETVTIQKDIPEGLNAACREGCLYNYRIFKTIKEVRKSSLSLTKEQIENFKENCFLYCNQNFKDVNIKIKQNKEEGNKGILEKKDKGDKSDLTPFEEL